MARTLDLQVLQSIPPEDRSAFAEQTLHSDFGLKPPPAKLSISAIRDPNLTGAERAILLKKIEQRELRLQQRLLRNLDAALNSYDRQVQDASPSEPIAAFNHARRHSEIGDTGAIIRIARGMAKDNLKARDKMVRLWSHLWQVADIQQIGKPAVLADVLRPVLVYGSPAAAGSLLKSLPKLHTALSDAAGPRQQLTKPYELEFLVRRYAEDQQVDGLERNLARHAWGKISAARPVANDLQIGTRQLPADASRLLETIIGDRPATGQRPARRGVLDFNR